MTADAPVDTLPVEHPADPVSGSEGALEADVRDDLLESLEREVGVLMRRARRVIALRASLVDPELMPTSYLVLGHICERGHVRASAVADLFDLDKGAVSRHVQHLVELGLVERSPDPEDRRATLLAPTERAHERMRHVVEARRARLRRRLGLWDDEGVATFVDLLGRYNSALEEIERADEDV